MGLIGPDLEEMLADVRRKLKKRGAAEEEDDPEDDEDNKEGSGSKRKWVDDVANRKAERDWTRMSNQVNVNLTRVETQMKERLKDYQSTPTRAAKFTDELQVVQRRLKALSLVLSGTEEELAAYIKYFEDSGNGDAASSVTAPRDLRALTRAGPCEGFEHLKVIGELMEHRIAFRVCATADEREDTNKCGRSEGFVCCTGLSLLSSCSGRCER